MIPAVLAVMLLGIGPGDGSTPRALQGLPQFHEMDSHGRSDPAGALPVTGVDAGRTPGPVVFGFLPYWIGASTLRYDLISVLACFSIEMGPAGGITSWHGFPSAFQAPVDGVHAAGGRAVVTVTCFSGSGIHSILTTGRSTALATLSDVLEDTDVDGICLDFEGVYAADADTLVSFVQDLRAAMEQVYPGSHLSICTPAVDWSGAFDYDLLAAECDALFMMCYPFHGSWSEEAGPCCPLTGWGSGPESPSNMAWTIGDYVIYAPEVHEKLVIGLPWYGFEWETEDGSPHSAATGSCSTLIYSTLASRAETYGRLWDDESLTPWYGYLETGWNQGWYDDEESIGLKFGLILGSGLQGAGIWALGYDGSRPELWDCIEDWFCNPLQPDFITDNLEAAFTLHGPAGGWHYSGTGQFYSHFYTYSVQSGPDQNWAEWLFDLPDSSATGTLDAWVPEGSGASASYRIEHGGLVDTVVVDQSVFQGQWISLGGPYQASGGLSVILGDCTGSAGDRIGFDAVRFTPQGGTVPEDPAGGHLFLTGANPAPGFAIGARASQGDARLLVVDCAGRVVFERDLPPGQSSLTWWPEEETAPTGIYRAVLLSDGRALPGVLSLVLLR